MSCTPFLEPTRKWPRIAPSSSQMHLLLQKSSFPSHCCFLVYPTPLLTKFSYSFYWFVVVVEIFAIAFCYFFCSLPVMTTFGCRRRYSHNEITFRHQNRFYMYFILSTTIGNIGFSIFKDAVEISAFKFCSLRACSAHHANNQKETSRLTQSEPRSAENNCTPWKT